MSKIKVDNTEITIISSHGQDYICLTDMVKNREGDQHIKNWFKNKNTLEYLAVWERLNNPVFNLVEFDLIRIEAGTNRFLMSPNQWVDKTKAIGVISKSGKHGGTYAHKDIALHFAMWLSPEFQLLIIKEYQLLKEKEASSHGLSWALQRLLTKVNYRLHTDAVKKYVVPKSTLPQNKEALIYAGEADILNLAVFGCTAREWREANEKAHEKCDNIRDCADKVQLIVLANMESLHTILLREGKPADERYAILKKEADIQLKALYPHYPDYSAIESPNLTKETESLFDKQLKGLLNTPPEKN